MIYVGTSGWNYRHWRELVYPKGTAQSKWLAWIAGEFNTVELNTSFYRIPTAKSMETWQSAVPPGFRFAVKLWRGITHYKKLKSSSGFVRRFLDVADTLAPGYRGPILIQLPPNQGLDPGKLDEFLREWRGIAHTGWRVAVEFRNDSWLTPETYRILDRHQAALCLHDMQGKASVDEPNDAKFVYIRRHGSSEAGPYQGSYSPSQLQRDAARIRAWNAEGKDVFIYYNNDIGGHAFYNARGLRTLCSA